jgi:hypothetical protein
VTEGTTVYLTRMHHNACHRRVSEHALAQCFFQDAKREVELSIQFLVLRNLMQHELAAGATTAIASAPYFQHALLPLRVLQSSAAPFAPHAVRLAPNSNEHRTEQMIPHITPLTIKANSGCKWRELDAPVEHLRVLAELPHSPS